MPKQMTVAVLGADVVMRSGRMIEQLAQPR